LELYKSIRALEIHAIQYHIKEWHKKHDPELKKLAKKLRKFHEQYVFKLKMMPLNYPRNVNGAKDPDVWQIYDRPDSPPRALVMDHINDQVRYSAIIKSQRKIEEPYVSLVRSLKKLDAINGSLKSQRLI